ncbi:transmembrane amino acid transporter protein-domain-containing protein [Umbelopsis sp. AD052]|nr:transmembrane amino acid transporter protein-domain-containing protein [Umbelopsis sp. AD052]
MGSPKPSNSGSPYIRPVTSNSDHARHRWEEDSLKLSNAHGNLATSFDRSELTARLSSSPARSIGHNSNRPEFERPSRSSTPVKHHEHHGDLPDEEIAKVVKMHLATGSPASSYGTSPHSYVVESDDARSFHQLPGGAITHGIYKYVENVEQEEARRKRSQSFSLPRGEPSDPALLKLRAPGGFRRHYVYKQAIIKGQNPPGWMTSSFVDFLALYGHFGGEDLEDDEGDEDLLARIDEEAPLLPGRELEPVQGTATPSKAVFLILKSFIGTGVMFLPKAFSNGGLLFSTSVMLLIAGLSLWSFLLLIQTRNKVPVSFGDMGGVLFGPAMRLFVLFSIAVSQVGFVCAYMVFVAQNIHAFIMSVSNCKTDIGLHWLIFAQLFIFVPLAMIRKIQKLSVFALIADLFILIGLSYLYYYDTFVLVTRGLGNIEWIINANSFPLFVGTAVFTFEGIGLVIPIAESMKEPEKFPKVLTGSMIFMTILFTSVGVVSYLAFGDKVETVILLNLPAHSAVVNSVQLLYAMAICLSIPLQLFPAIRIMENGLFTLSGKTNMKVKWQKNMFRFGMVVVCAIIAIGGSNDLDKFVSIIGSACCIPLGFLFPPLFHMKAIAVNWRQRAGDIFLIVFGMSSMIYTSAITISLWTSGGSPEPSMRCIPVD